MSRLYLLRHAKSSWKDASLHDHDRPLAPRGRQRLEGDRPLPARPRLQPELVLCSSAKRARQTLERLGPAGLDARIEPELYGAGTNDLLARLHEVPEEVASVMLIGHNPGMQQLAHLLAGLDDKFPTAALATLECPGLAHARARRADRLRPSARPRCCCVLTATT